ncbi:hypothetical protein [Chenggangzhangella methanolivorans]|uniref:Uncharacterized protein n=1 Tax=Chenggangzhangella methanolivorans TaxID=1437009 RepID=A0A9E6UMG5_9HYPH|nr:hypothetical protein [Chenggangzhangella methanolivorans]QZO01652.1 hypothetical protein K6K41_09780 [Chenggangzhangella methanolivorans]
MFSAAAHFNSHSREIIHIAKLLVADAFDISTRRATSNRATQNIGCLMTHHIDEEIAFAERKVEQAADAVSNQIHLVFRLKTKGIDLSGAEDRLRDLNLELRQWKEYKTLLFIRKGMTVDHQSE